jgi:LmbE family N-acetylglucosaminyl deacetylase
MNKVLIIAAHPDDDILGCGGYMSKFSNKMKFRVVFIAEGSSCRFTKDKTASKNVKDIISERNNFGINALKILGIDDYKFYNLPCGRLDQIPLIEINKIIEKEIIDFNIFRSCFIFCESARRTFSNKNYSKFHFIRKLRHVASTT